MAISQPRVRERVLAFYQGVVDDPHHRYRSWEHCYQYFQQQPIDIEHACLHLGMYLASWGMYRGSSFLLQKDYLVHRPAIELLLQPRYQALRAASLVELTSDLGPTRIALIMELVSRIKQCYTALLGTATLTVNVTDTLATKILLGTLGCTPAYDRFFVEGLKKSGLSFPYLNAKNFSALISYCLAYRHDFSQAQRYILAARGVDYPDMKVIDMYFWMLGADERTA